MEAKNKAERDREAQRPLEEAGEGVSEGFELAEADLIEHASHGDSGPDPRNMAGKPEAERSNAEYGDADHEKSSEDDED